MLFAVFCFVCLLVFGGMYLAQRRAKPAAARRAAVRWARVELPADRYYHPGHTWAKPVESGEVLVGLDAFARRFVGDVKALEVPRLGEKLEQGRAAWKIRFDGRDLEQPAPVRGQVVEVNEDLLRHPEKLRDDPYGEGWILKVKPQDEDCCSANLFGADLARRWVELAIQELQRAHSPLAGVVSQDGGELVEGIARHLDDEQWKRFKRRYFPVA